MTAQASRLVEQLVLKSCDPPIIDISINPQVIFEDESAVLSWSIADASCAESRIYTFLERLTEDTENISGTRIISGEWGEFEPLSCSLEMDGVTSFTPGVLGPHHRTHSINARNLMGEEAVASADMDILSLPQVSACTGTRERAIKSAVKNVYVMLKGGCIASDGTLDATVDVFSRGLISRGQLWGYLLRELMNINVDTFVCQDVEDEEWGGGHWTEYANNISLDWSPSWSPYLEYVILHELIHKCGLNNSLREHYLELSDSEFMRTIEEQAHTISGSCFD